MPLVYADYFFGFSDLQFQMAAILLFFFDLLSCPLT